MRCVAAAAAALHDAGFDVVAPRERDQLPRIEHAFEARQRAAHVKRALLPVAAKEFARRQAAEQILFHRSIICSDRATPLTCTSVANSKKNWNRIDRDAA